MEPSEPPRRPKAGPNRRALTDLFIKAIKPQAKRVLYWDTKQEGLVLSVEPTGGKSYKLIYTHSGRPRWFTIGKFGKIGLKEARKIAREKMGEIYRGVDIQGEKVAARKAGTFEDLAARYIEQYAKRNLKAWRQSKYKVETYLLPRWRHLQAQSIRRSDVRAMFNAITSDGSPVTANQAVAQASAIFSWAIKNEVVDLPGNPAHGIDHNKTKARERVLSDNELPLFWAAFENAGLVRSRALRMILLTGQRPGEITCMRREHVEVGDHRLVGNNGKAYVAHGGWWKLPGDPDPQVGWPGTKNAQTHRVWLPEPALAILEEMHEGKSGFVFAGPLGRPVGGLSSAMRKLCKQLDVDEKVTPHDLRRTHGTTVTALGFSRDQLNRLQNHKEGGIASVYDRHSYAHENRVIQEAVAKRIMELAEGSEAGSNVVPLTG